MATPAWRLLRLSGQVDLRLSSNLITRSNLPTNLRVGYSFGLSVRNISNLKANNTNSLRDRTLSWLSRNASSKTLSLSQELAAQVNSFTAVPFPVSDTARSNEAFTDASTDAVDTDSEYAARYPTKRIVGYWFLYCAALVFAIVVVGGVTRLTESGLSITEWNLISGMKPPRTEEEWNVEFNKYKLFPEYKLLNHNITLNEFKFIFYMEWGHRMLGRFIGLSFILPGLYFAARGYMSPAIRNRSLLIATLIGGQGILGWYMVKSGLREELMEAKAFHGVSQYWLAAHLGSAFIIYSMMLLTGFEILRTSGRNASVLAKQIVTLTQTQPAFKTFSRSTHQIATLIFLTAFSGAFVAGLDAGLIYNEFPFMGNSLMPSDMWALSDAAVHEKPIPKWRNLLENASAVQFNHRWLAMTTATAVAGLWVASRRFTLPRSSRLAVNALIGVTALQVTLGISTLLYLVPVPLAAAHQSGSLLLLSTSLWLLHTLRRLPK
ncbi:Cytochrome c oxidase assembly protein cox15 [Physocladia obscura]|uniref:Cytochrome c oxidase assembly protein cox15 n=1 Tax=Physocladia obscura TaxID=109957 RepID=A0AAD5TAR3_9FUNG|nr:Cytochrome c oxidase assembly protein cox15 [Physocladia obscura]